jgi:hypothetical protein
MDELESHKSHQVSVQIPRGFHSEVPPQDVVRAVAPVSWRGVPQAGGTERELDRGRAFDVRPCPHDDLDPAEYAVSQVVGFIKGKSAIHLARTYGEHRRNFVGQSFWAEILSRQSGPTKR